MSGLITHEQFHYFFDHQEEATQQLASLIHAFTDEFTQESPFTINYNASVTEAYIKTEQEQEDTCTTATPMDELSFTSDTVGSEVRPY